MRSIARCGVGVLGFLLIGCGERGDQQQGQAMIDLGPVNANNVNIIVRCRGQQAGVSLVPWRPLLNIGETVTFNLRGGANTVSTVTIQPKVAGDLNSWPFNGSVITVSTGQPATTPAAPSNTNTIVYPYAVHASCPFPAQGQNTVPGPRPVILDPDLIVRGTTEADSVGVNP